MPVPGNQIRQAVVIVHGMGEQRPLETLSGFINAALPPRADQEITYYSRPDKVTDSYEARRYLAPKYPPDGEEQWAQTEFYEYHWAHLMQGNRLADLWPTFRRMLLQVPWTVPSGLRVVWALFWLAIGAAAWAFWRGPWSDIDLAGISAESLVRSILGGGLVAEPICSPGWSLRGCRRVSVTWSDTWTPPLGPTRPVASFVKAWLTSSRACTGVAGISGSS